jgi:citrate synthase
MGVPTAMFTPLFVISANYTGPENLKFVSLDERR